MDEKLEEVSSVGRDKVAPLEAYILTPPPNDRSRRQSTRRSNSGKDTKKVSDSSSQSKADEESPVGSEILVRQYAFKRSVSDGGTIWQFDKHHWAESVADSTKAIKLLGIDMNAIERAKCLRMMGVTEDDYQKSLEVFDVFNKIDSMKSGTMATEKARQILGVNDVSLKLDKPFRTLGIDCENLDRDRMVALSLLGSDQEMIKTPLNDGGQVGTLCSCSLIQRRTSF